MMTNSESLAALASGNKERLRGLVLEHICDRREHGATVDEACQALGLLPSSVAPRFSELRRAGLIVRLHDAKGQRVRRLTRQGCPACVLIDHKIAPVETNPGPLPVVTPQPPQTSTPAESDPKTDSLFGDLNPEPRYPD